MLRIRKVALSLTVPLLLSEVPSDLPAQAVFQVSRAQAIKFVQRGGAGVLRNGPRPEQLAEVEATADTLLAIILSPDPQEIPGMARVDAIALVLEAGNASTGAGTTTAGDRLLRVAEGAPSSGHRSVAAMAIGMLKDKETATRLLRRIATSGGSAGRTAVDALATDAGPIGRATLKSVIAEGLITEPRALQQVRMWKAKFGWQ